MTYTPDSLRALEEKTRTKRPFSHSVEAAMFRADLLREIGEGIDAHADEWEAQIKAVEREANAAICAWRADNAALRERLEALLTIIHNLRTCKGNATDDGPCGQCVHAADVALASQPPESET